MWIAQHPGDKKAVSRILQPEKTYRVGRSPDVDIIFQSRKTARELLELRTGPPSQQTSGKTALNICVLSRAKCIINGETVRLKKGQSPIDLDLSHEFKIVLEVERDSEPHVVDTPLTIEWVECKLYTESTESKKNGLVQGLIQLKVDVAVVDEINEATHFHTSESMPDSNDFKKAIVRGMHLVNDSWFETALDEPNDPKWVLECDNVEYMPSHNRNFAPNRGRSDFCKMSKFLSFEKIGWLDTVIVAKNSEQDIKVKAGNDEFILVNSSDVFSLKAIDEDDLFRKIVDGSYESIPRNKIPDSKRLGEPVTGHRKRRKYEKVDKLHFFSLGESPHTSPTKAAVSSAPQGSDESSHGGGGGGGSQPTLHLSKAVEAQNVEAPQEHTETAETPSSLTTTTTHSNPDQKFTRKLPPVETAASETKHVETPNPLKRKITESFTAHTPPKIAKFTPKVSFADAVVQAKESSLDFWNKEFGIPEVNKDTNADYSYGGGGNGDGDYNADNAEVYKNLSNLVIVEIVDVPLRKRPSAVLSDASSTTNTTTKNFKNFRKSTPKRARQRIPMVSGEMPTVANQNARKIHRTTIEDELGGAMSEVRGDHSPLFVRDDEDEDEEKNDDDEADSIFQDMRRRNGHRPGTAVNRGANGQTDSHLEDDYDDDDDDDDDDDQPKFGFSRA
ncbi:uncharacterized protein LODBEIA_P43140 [Lodderomyces beijingensis]|uniref:FHA domain-containing protein n=1 Tax=Lodderomyces beijingensis TaxID=1775926 RepID=A0ABP0ZPL6_9ASCO